MMLSTKNNLRIVIDSNVWISALVFGGNPREIIEQAVDGKYQVVMSDEIISEVRRILHQKFPDFVDDFEALLAVLKPILKFVTLGSINIDVSRDPDDNRVIETAILGRVSYLVSGDKDLLVIKKYKNIAILQPTDFLLELADPTEL